MGSWGTYFVESFYIMTNLQILWRHGAVIERSVSCIYADRMLKVLNAFENRFPTLA